WSSDVCSSDLELCTRGYLVMLGYREEPEKTQEVLGDDGWLRTGDVARMDENGYVQVTGRMKDMVIRGGENIYPRDIEEFLYTHPHILHAPALRAPHPPHPQAPPPHPPSPPAPPPPPT